MSNEKSFMSRAARWALGLIVLFVIGVQVFFAGFYHNVADLELKVIDSETKQPISGVVLVAFWEKWTSTLGGSNPAGVIAIKESVSDPEGRVGYSGWQEWFPKEKFPPQYSPTLVLIAEDYKASILKNYNYERPNNLFIVGEFYPLASIWNGETIELRKLGTDSKGFIIENLEASRSISKLDNKSSICLWEKVPHYFLLKARHSFKTRKYNFKNYTLLDSLEGYYSGKNNCQNFGEFKKRHLE